jgi:hypothetical protein
MLDHRYPVHKRQPVPFLRLYRFMTHLLILLPGKDDVIFRAVVGNERLLDVLDICVVLEDVCELNEAAPDSSGEPPIVWFREDADLGLCNLGSIVLVAGHQAVSIRRRDGPD